MKLIKNNISIENYKKLFDTFYTSLCIFSNKYTNSLEASKDIVQEVFIKLWKEQIEFSDNDNIKAYIYIAVRNKSLDYLKSKEYKSKIRLDSEIIPIII